MHLRKRGIGVVWLWWVALILLLLRLTHAANVDVLGSEVGGANEADENAKPQKKTADELGVPRCESDYDCVSGGVCRKDEDGYGRCLCSSSCPAHVPVHCGIFSRAKKGSRRNQTASCLMMDENYKNRFSFMDPLCHNERCVCPPMFDEVATSKRFPIRTLPPRRCDKRELKVFGYVVPSEAVYKGNDVIMYCCINMDPTGVVDASGVFLIHNASVSKDPTSHPFHEGHEFDRNYIVDTPCWTLEIRNVQFSDSGSYMCVANHASKNLPAVNSTMEFEVKAHISHPPFSGIFYHRRSKKGGTRMRARASTMVRNVTVIANSTSANVTWETEPDSTMKIDLRLVNRGGGGRSKEQWSSEDAKSPLTISKLSPATAYTLFITVKPAGQVEPIQLTEHFQTQEKQPGTARLEDIRLIHDDRGSGLLFCEVDWREPSFANGRITSYYVRMQGKVRAGGGDSLVSDDYPLTTDPKCANYDQSESPEKGVNPVDFAPNYYLCRFGPLKPNRNYTATIWAVNSAGMSKPVSFARQCITNFAEPDQVETPTTLPPSNLTNFRLKFGSPPDQSNGPISCYYVAVVPLFHNVSLDSLSPPETITIESFAAVFNNNLKTTASETNGYFAYIAESYAKDFPIEALIGDGNTTSGMQQCSVTYLSRYKSEDSALRTGLKYTGFLIVRVDKDENLKESLAPDSKRPLIGRKHRQVHLSGPSYAYSPYFKPVYLQTSNDEGSLTTLLLLLGVLFVFAVVGGLSFAYFKLIRGKKLSGGDHIPLKMSVYGPVEADSIPGEYRDRHKDSDFIFSQEFEKLPHYNYDSSASTRKENTPKNRYNDIRAFETTRVKLKKLDGEEFSDYINANYIKGYDPHKCFIAAQGPLPGTVADFWRMCWEQDVRIVVMVANLVEKTRQQCAKYWTDEEPLRAGNLTVTPCGTEYYSEYVIRKFDICDTSNAPANRLSPINIPVNQSRSISDLGASIESHVGSEYANLPPGTTVTTNAKVDVPPGPNCRRIVQYHFTNWNDYKAPECSTSLLRFLHMLRELDDFSSTPVVVHCSAGVGRTGTLVAIDSMLDQYEKEDQVDVFKFVSQMRTQRNLMVQSPEQYTFIYKALAEWHLFGHSDMDETTLLEHYKKLMEPKGAGRDRTQSVSGKANRLSAAMLAGTGMEEEFKKLEEELEPRPKTMFADEPSNIMKNRFRKAIPYDRNRVCLQPLIGYTDSSYINASHVKGYFYPYILAQDPMDESTCFDFWRMLFEQKVSTVVMLTPEEDFAPSEKYWPEEVSECRVLSRESQSVTVTLLGEERSQSHYVRKMEYFMKSDLKPRTVYQFCFLNWPSTSPTPQSSESLLHLISRVLERQSHFADAGATSRPIVLHCRNGSSETAVYCAVSFLSERLKAEHRVDVLQTVRMLQTQRPETFTKVEEYAFCYQAIVDYIRQAM